MNTRKKVWDDKRPWPRWNSKYQSQYIGFTFAIPWYNCFVGISQGDDEFKSLLRCWEGDIKDSSDMLHYQHAWSNLFDVLLSTAVSKSISPSRFPIVILQMLDIIYQHWKSVYSGANQVFIDYDYSIISEILCDLRPSDPSGKWQTWLQENGAKLQTVLASRPLTNNYFKF